MTRDVGQALQQSCSSADGKLDLKSLERKRHMQAKAAHQISPNREAVLAIGTEIKDYRNGPEAVEVYYDGCLSPQRALSLPRLG